MNALLRWYYAGRYCPLTLMRKEVIGPLDGYFECRQEQFAIASRMHELHMQGRYEQATTVIREGYARIERQYFGPRLVRKPVLFLPRAPQ